MNHKINFEEPSVSDECKVCHQPSHGVHFGVVSCRACAAFFRRCMVLKKEYSCRRLDSKCELEKIPRDFCRHCRLNKCKFVGMTEENVQRNRDTGKAQILQVPDVRRNFTRCPVFDMTTGKSEIIKKIEEFRIPEENDEYDSKNSLEKMDFSLKQCRRKQKRDGIEVITSINFERSGMFWSDAKQQVLNWMMHAKVFRELESNEKFELFNSIWLVWQRFERLTMTLEIFGQRTIDEKILLLTNSHAACRGKLKFGGVISKSHDSNRIHEIFDPLDQKLIDDVAKTLLEVQPTSMEVSYMLCQIVWQSSGKKFQGKILTEGEKFLDEIANDLHLYYKEKRMANYASRLARMMGVVKIFEKDQEERMKMYELAHLFDLFRIE